MLKVKILAKGKFTLSQKSEVILVASSAIGTMALMYLLPERCCCGMSENGQIASENPSVPTEEVEIDPQTDDSDEYQQITAQDCGITSDMSFGEAFNHARSHLGRGCVFAWHGKLYNTFFKEEWLAMSLEDRQAFMNSIDFSYVPADDLPTEVRSSNDNPLDNNDLNNNNYPNNNSEDNSHNGDSENDHSPNGDSDNGNSQEDDSHDGTSQEDDSDRQRIGGDTEGSDEHLVHLSEDPTGLFESHAPPEDEPVNSEDVTHLSEHPDYNDDANTSGMEYFH